MFAAELPVLPLYYRLKITLAQPDFCGIEMNASTRSTFWNIEVLDYGEYCQ